MFKEFREFALKGNLVDIAVGMLLGAGITPIAKSIVDDLIMPPLGILLGQISFKNFFLVIREGATPGPYLTLEQAERAGATIMRFGNFFSTCMSFLVVAFVAFLFVKAINRFKRELEEDAKGQTQTTKVCPFCLSIVPLAAKKCSHCTSSLETSD